MAAQMHNPGVQAGASRNQLGGWLQASSTASDRQAQFFGRCFYFSPHLARDMALLCFGEASHD